MHSEEFSLYFTTRCYANYLELEVTNIGVNALQTLGGPPLSFFPIPLPLHFPLPSPLIQLEGLGERCKNPIDVHAP